MQEQVTASGAPSETAGRVVRAAPQRQGSGGGFGIVAVFIALLFIIGPLAAPANGLNLSTGSQLLLMGFGVVLLVGGVVLLTITRLYLRAPADLAYVRTGMGGPVAVIDGGALIIPVVHEVTPVSLRTMRLEVARHGEQALITRDFLRVDITAEFFIKVPKERESVLTAATSLGLGAADERSVAMLLEKKLESALRQVAAEMALHDLLVSRQEFINRVMTHVNSDIANNGLALETVTISNLDQTPIGELRADTNVFDAQGSAKAAQIVAEQAVIRNQAKLSADRAIRQEQVRTAQSLAQQDVIEASAQAQRDREIAEARATAEREARTVSAEQARLAGLAEVERDRELQVAAVTREQAVAVAQQQQQQAVRTAEVTAQQAAEVATRLMAIAIAQKEEEQAQARARQLEAQAEQERQAQAVTTVQVTAGAEREKAQAVIQAQAQAEQKRLAEQITADVAAYARTKQAQAEQDAAARLAAARLTEAEATQKARALEAQGERAMQMVPVDVAREQVGVEQAKVEVLRRELESKAQFESIARELQVELARIEAEKTARIAQAEAIGNALAAAHMTVWGDPDSLARMSAAFYQGQQAGYLVDGLASSTPDGVKAALGGLAGTLASYVRDKFGVELTPQQMQGLLDETRQATASTSNGK